jgi:FkbM family methyltransferase
MKKHLRKLISSATRLIGASRVGEAMLEAVLQGGMERTQAVSSRGVSLRFAVPNRINRFRAKTFVSKEPETLDWIDQLPEGCVLWDIGANVGLYSIYAAKKRKIRVVAFEPSVFNLELLARNLFLNELQECVNLVPLALNNQLGPNQLRMTTTEWGGALSSFGQNFGWDGKTMDPVFSFSTLGISMDEAVTLLRLTPPDFIKMDVDGIEHLILRGGGRVLGRVRGILLEINDGFAVQAEESRRLLEAAGLSLKARLHAPIIEESAFANVYNQIWIRE